MRIAESVIIAALLLAANDAEAQDKSPVYMNSPSKTVGGPLTITMPSGELADQPSYNLTIESASMWGGLRSLHKGTGAVSYAPSFDWFHSIDDFNAGARTVTGLDVDLYVGTAPHLARGHRSTITGNLFLNYPTANSDQNGNYAGVVGYTVARSADNGVIDKPSGSLFGGGFRSVACGTNITSECPLGTAATHLFNLSGAEFNVTTFAGSSVWYRSGVQVVDLDSVEAGGGYDIGYALGNAGGRGFEVGLGFTSAHGSPPISVSGTLIKAMDAATVRDGIDLTAYNFNRNAWASKGAAIDGEGRAHFTTAGIGTSQPIGLFDIRMNSNAHLRVAEGKQKMLELYASNDENAGYTPLSISGAPLLINADSHGDVFVKLPIDDRAVGRSVCIDVTDRLFSTRGRCANDRSGSLLPSRRGAVVAAANLLDGARRRDELTDSAVAEEDDAGLIRQMYVAILELQKQNTLLSTEIRELRQSMMSVRTER